MGRSQGETPARWTNARSFMLVCSSGHRVRTRPGDPCMCSASMQQSTYGDVAFAACLLWLGNLHGCMYMCPCPCLMDVWVINDHAETFWLMRHCVGGRGCLVDAADQWCTCVMFSVRYASCLFRLWFLSAQRRLNPIPSKRPMSSSVGSRGLNPVPSKRPLSSGAGSRVRKGLNLQTTTAFWASG